MLGREKTISARKFILTIISAGCGACICVIVCMFSYLNVQWDLVHTNM